MNTLEDLQALLNKNSLSFPKNLESLFIDDYYNRSLKTIRVALVLAFILYFAFGFLDIIMAPSTKHIMWIIRYVMVSPILLVSLALTYTPLFKKIMQHILGICSITMGAGIIAMIAIAKDIESVLYYYAGLILVITWTYTFVRLRFVYASAVCWLIIAGYELSAVLFQHMTGSSDLLRAFINNNFFFLSANIIGMLVCYSIETSSRRDFLQRRMIEEKTEDLQNERNKLRDRNEVMENDLQMARIIQEEMIPDKAPNDNTAFLFKPMEPVGGDFFDFINFREHEKIGIFISDVSGHGASAALITSMIKSILGKSSSLKDDPVKLMYSLNESLINHTGTNFITAFYCVYSIPERTIHYVNAGHPYPMIITEDGIRNLNTKSSLPLAIIDNESIKDSKRAYICIEEILPEKSKLMFFTDGLMEASTDAFHKNMFMDNIDSVLLELRHQKSGEFIQSLYQRLVDFKGGDRFDDDICIICMDID
jgi:serine phosphatase RsbU (regulator of sigma subunit)